MAHSCDLHETYVTCFIIYTFWVWVCFLYWLLTFLRNKWAESQDMLKLHLISSSGNLIQLTESRVSRPSITGGSNFSKSAREKYRYDEHVISKLTRHQKFYLIDSQFTCMSKCILRYLISCLCQSHKLLKISKSNC